VPDDLLTFRNSQKVAARGQFNAPSSPIKKIRVHRDSHDVFGDEQKWVDTPPIISFIDETAHVDAQYRHHQLRYKNTVGDSSITEDPGVLPQDDNIENFAPITTEDEADGPGKQDQGQTQPVPRGYQKRCDRVRTKGS
jgi:hypothetical protein